MTDKEIDLSMNKALKRLPFEIKKIKLILFIVKNMRRIFK